MRGKKEFFGFFMSSCGTRRLNFFDKEFPLLAGELTFLCASPPQNVDDKRIGRIMTS